MLHRENDRDLGRGISRRHAPDCMILASPFPMAPFFFTVLDTGGPDEFTFTTAGDFACFWGLCPCKQGKVTVAS